MLTYVSLFAGVGGLDLAVERWAAAAFPSGEQVATGQSRQGARCLAQVEWDPACTRVLERWWPDVPRWGDVATYPDHTRFGAEPQPSESDRDAAPITAIGVDARTRSRIVDFIVGGFPCQPVSHAGKRKGTADDRWLWPEFARVVGELGPRYVLVENVPGLLTVNGGRAFSEILGTLADLGYDATWTSLRASDIGAPHRRQRVFILAHAQRPGSPRAGGHTQPSRALDGVSDEGPEAPAAGFPWGPYEAAIRRWERVMGPAPAPVDAKRRLDPAFVEWMMGFPAGWTEGMTRTAALKALGNAVVPQQASAALALLTEMRRAA